ncbi:hypothetical protein B005_1226 [Nocardiopsis alba ATCC BAA-2165]|uniref:Uncharacterized protein n=1 Tax=Nocardiopsis alba (strain ATCC BAA-2165 / BE74) TaxID=1205910 RepID=J7LD00_NOCAA|nr:hypothetical protein B005_1226 [Nocardiopsis alba ATCC BAA-2165]
MPLSRKITDETQKEDLEEFKRNFSALISDDSNRGGLYRYMAVCSDYAEAGRLNGFRAACEMRSTLQIFEEHFIIWSESQREDFHGLYIEEIEDIDWTLKDVSDEAPPIREKDIPVWVPESHWWWRSPVQQDMSDEEIRKHLEYVHWDGF